MMNAKIKWIEDQKMLGESGTGHSVVMDALDSGKGVSPMEMLLPVSYTHLTLPTICSV